MRPAPDPAAALAAIHLARYPHVSISPGNAPGGGTRGALHRLFAELVALDAAAAAAAEALASASHRIPNTLPPEGAIREAFAALRAPAKRPGLEAWGDVMALFRRGFSAYRPPTEADVKDPIAWSCLQALGWQELCRSSSDDLGVMRAHFVRAYEARQDHQQRAGVVATVGAARRYLEAKGLGELVGQVAGAALESGEP